MLFVALGSIGMGLPATTSAGGSATSAGRSRPPGGSPGVVNGAYALRR